MRKWRKALTCGLLGTLAVCLSTVAFAMQPQPVQALQQGVQTTISGESSYWQETKGFFHMPSNSLSYVNTAQMVDVTGDGYGDGYMSTATSQKLDGNTQIDISMKGYFTGDAGTGYWGYNWIIFQNTTEMYTGTASSIRTASNWTPFRLRVDESPSNSVGNWFALVFGKTENAVNLYECNSGEVKKIHTLYQSSGEEDAVKAHSIHAKTTDISIKTSDSATGVTVDITYTVGGNTYTYKHSSDNNALLGEQTLTLGYHGGVQCTTENGAYTKGTFSYDVKVTTSQSAMTYESYNGLQGYTQATGEGEWVSTTNLSTNATGDLITVSAPSRPTGTSDVFSSYAETKQVGGNSTLDLTINGTIQRDPNWAESVGLWAYDWILFKNTNANSGREWDPRKQAINEKMAETGEVLEGGYTAQEGENWIALVFGASQSVDKEGKSAGAALYECRNGVIERYPLESSNWPGTGNTMSGYDVWYTYAQTTHIKITTKDTATGVWVKLTYYASGCTKATNTGYVYEFTYYSENTNLWGEQSYVIGHFGNGKFDATENYTYDMRVMDAPSPFTHNVAGNYLRWDLEEAVNGESVEFLGENGMRFNGSGLTGMKTSAMLIKENVRKDSTLTFEIYGNAPTIGAQVNSFIMLKNKSDLPSPALVQAPAQDLIDNTNAIASGDIPAYYGTWSYASTGDWLALYFGKTAKHFWVFECTNGTVKVTPIYGPTNFNYAHWYLNYNQTTAMTVTTRDTDTGVRVAVDLTVWGCTNANGASIYDVGTQAFTTSISYTSTNVNLHGDYALSVGVHANMEQGQYVDFSWMSVYAPGAEIKPENSATGLYAQDMRGAWLSMHGNVGINIYMALAPRIWDKADGAQVDFYIQDVEMPIYSEFVADLQTETYDGTLCHIISCGLPPKDYDKPMRVILVLDEETRYIVHDYEEGAIVAKQIDAYKNFYAEGKIDEVTYDAVVALEDYCHASREYFNYEDSGYVDTMTMEAPEVALDAVLSNDNKVATTFWTTNNGEVALLDGLKPSDFAYNSVSLLLKTETVFRLYIKTTNISKYNVVVDYDITDNESMLDYFYEDRNKGAVVKTWTRAEESDLYYVEITGIPASDFDKKFAITVEDTETFNKCTYVCNVYSYMRTMFRRDNPNDVYQTQINTLLRYMYVYHMKAVAYNSVHAKGDA